MLIENLHVIPVVCLVVLLTVILRGSVCFKPLGQCPEGGGLLAAKMQQQQEALAALEEIPEEHEEDDSADSDYEDRSSGVEY